MAKVVRKILGCDIGNGYGYVSFLDDEKKDPVSLIPRIIKDGMPTAAYITPPSGDPIVVYDSKKGAAETGPIKSKPDQGVFAVKTRLHEGELSFPGMDKTVSVDKVYATVARDLIRVANEELKLYNRQKGIEGEEIACDIVFTYPASFESNIPLLNRMQSSIESMEIEGHPIQVVGRLPEPAAVAIDYLYYRQNLADEAKQLKDGCTVLVYDLGHGTFDVALVSAGKSKEEPYKIWDNDGLPDVGGKDFDKLLFDEVIRVLKEEHGCEVKGARIREFIRKEVVEAKKTLSEKEEAEITYSSSDGDLISVVITRKRFEELIMGKIVYTMEKVEQMRQVAEKNHLKIDAFVLSGGSSRIPMVSRMIEEIAGDIDTDVYRTSQAVSFGAARYAHGNRANQYTAFKFGFWDENDGGLKGTVKMLVDSHTVLPATSPAFTVDRKSGRQIVKLYRATAKDLKEDTIASDSKEGTSIMWIPFDIPEGVTCEYTFTVEEDKNITVTCTLSNGTVIRKSTADSAKKLTE